MCKIVFIEMPMLQLVFLSPFTAFLLATACVYNTVFDFRHAVNLESDINNMKMPFNLGLHLHQKKRWEVKVSLFFFFYGNLE